MLVYENRTQSMPSMLTANRDLAGLIPSLLCRQRSAYTSIMPMVRRNQIFVPTDAISAPRGNHLDLPGPVARRASGLPNEPEQKERAKSRGETDNWLSNPDRKSERKGDSQQSRSAFPELREREKRQRGDFHD